MDKSLWFMEARHGVTLYHALFDSPQGRPGGKRAAFVVRGDPAPDEAAAREEAAVYLEGLGDPPDPSEVPDFDALVVMGEDEIGRWEARCGWAAAGIPFRDHALGRGEQAWLLFGSTKVVWWAEDVPPVPQ